MSATEAEKIETIKALSRKIEKLEEAIEELEWRTNHNRHYTPTPPRTGPLGAVARRVIKRRGPRADRNFPI